MQNLIKKSELPTSILWMLEKSKETFKDNECVCLSFSGKLNKGMRHGLVEFFVKNKISVSNDRSKTGRTIELNDKSTLTLWTGAFRGDMNVELKCCLAL